jgi:hypothetical protein
MKLLLILHLGTLLFTFLSPGLRWAQAAQVGLKPQQILAKPNSRQALPGSEYTIEHVVYTTVMSKGRARTWRATGCLMSVATSSKSGQHLQGGFHLLIPA